MSIVLTPGGTGPEPTGGFVATDTTSLREIEQEVARRVGPFALHTVHNYQPGEPAQPVSTTTTVAIDAIRSSLDLGGMTDMYVLRRGRLADGTLLPTEAPDETRPFDLGDRIRLVRQYRPQEGVLEVDRAYAYPTHDGEEVELHHLEPQQELRPAVLAGLRRCYVVDRLQVDPVPQAITRVIDLTAVAPWLLSRDQVYLVATSNGAPLVGWRVEGYGGGLFLAMGEWGFGQLGPAVVVNRRPAPAMTLPFLNGSNGSAFVPRAGNVNEPWDDEDRFPVPLDYAAAAGHIEGWRNARPRLTAVAQIGMWADQKEAAAEFTRVSTVYFDPPRYESMLSVGGRRWPDRTDTNAP